MPVQSTPRVGTHAGLTRIQKLTLPDSSDIEFVAEVTKGLVDLSSEGTSGNPADLFDPADAEGTFTNELKKKPDKKKPDTLVLGRL